MRVDGGPSMANVTDMGKALGANYNDASVAALKAEFDANLGTIKHLAELDGK